MKGITIMYDHKWKKWGFIASAISVLLMILERLHPFIIFKKWGAPQHYILLEWLMLGSLFMVAFCKEQYDDERAQAIRLRALQMTFMVQNGIILAVGLTLGTAKGLEQIPPELMFAIAGFGIVFYLIMFHVGLYFDELWEYDNKSVFTNMRNIGKNKWAVLAYLLLSAVVLALVTLL